VGVVTTYQAFPLRYGEGEGRGGEGRRTGDEVVEGEAVRGDRSKRKGRRREEGGGKREEGGGGRREAGGRRRKEEGSGRTEGGRRQGIGHTQNKNLARGGSQ
jgi:hypothetical protein